MSHHTDLKKKDCFSLCEKMISQMSLYLPLTAISYKRLVTGFGKKKSTFWHNSIRTLNEQTLMRKYLCVYWRKFQSSSLGVCCLNEIPFVASSLSAKKKGNEHRTMSATKFTSGGTQTKTFVELLCTPSFGGGLHQRFTFFSVVHILLSMRAFFINSLILVALHKESSFHPPSLFADKT